MRRRPRFPEVHPPNLSFLSSHSLTGGVAAWRVAPRVAPARSAPLEKMVNFSSRYARILSKIGALRAILVKSARYARSNLASGALRASQHSLTEVGVKWFFLQCGFEVSPSEVDRKSARFG